MECYLEKYMNHIVLNNNNISLKNDYYYPNNRYFDINEDSVVFKKTNCNYYLINMYNNCPTSKPYINETVLNKCISTQSIGYCKYIPFIKGNTTDEYVEYYETTYDKKIDNDIYQFINMNIGDIILLIGYNNIIMAIATIESKVYYDDYFTIDDLDKNPLRRKIGNIMKFDCMLKNIDLCSKYVKLLTNTIDRNFENNIESGFIYLMRTKEYIRKKHNIFKLGIVQSITKNIIDGYDVVDMRFCLYIGEKLNKKFMDILSYFNKTFEKIQNPNGTYFYKGDIDKMINLIYSNANNELIN